MIRRTTKLLLEIVAIVSAGIAILVVMAAFKLASGPLSVGFLTPYIVGALQPKDGSLTVEIEEAVLTWGGWERAIRLRADHVRILDAAGELRGEIPEMTIGFSGRALMRAQLAPTSLEVVRPRLRFIRTQDGRVQFADGNAVAPPDAAPTAGQPAQERVVPGQSAGDVAPAEPPLTVESEEEERARVAGELADRVIVDVLSPPGPDNKMGYLRSLSILDADLTLEDRLLDITWRSPSASFVLLKGGNGLRLRGTFGFDIGGETAEFVVNGAYNTADEEITADVALADIEPARFAATAPLFEALDGIRLPVSGLLRVRADFDGTVQSVLLDVTAGSGTLALPGQAPDTAVAVNSVRLRATLTADLTVAQVDELIVDLDGGRVAMTGAVQGVSQGVVNGPFELAAELSVSDLRLDALKRLWPVDAAANARAWVVANMEQGLIRAGKFNLTGTAGEDGLASLEITNLDGGFAFSDIAISYWAPLPPVRGGRGEAKVSADRLTFTITAGTVQGLGLQIGSGKIDITGLDAEDQFLAVEAVVRGRISQVLTLLDHPRLGYAKALGVKPNEVGGDAAVRLLVRLPLIDALSFKQVQLAAAAALRGATMPRAAFDLDLSQGDLTLQLDGRGMDITGKAVLGRTPLQLTWTENFEPKGFARQFRIKATVDDAGRQEMGLDFPEYIRGPVGVDAVVTQFPNRANTVSLNADLTPAVVELSDLVWRKPPGARGTLKADLALTGERPTTVKSFALDAEGFRANGSAAFSKDGKQIDQVKLDRLAYGRSDVSGGLARRADGGLDIELVGPSFDAAPILRGDSAATMENAAAPGSAPAAAPTPASAAAAAPLTPLSIAMTLGTLHLSEEGALSNVSLRMRRDTKHWRTITVDGQPAPGKVANLTLSPEGAHRRLSARSDDAGGIFRAIGITDKIVGGALRLDATYDDSQANSPLSGKIEAEEFRLIDAPVIAKLLSVALLTGVLDSLRGEGIGFDRLDVPFTMRDEVIETKNAKAHGPALGITAEGWISLKSETVGLRGTLVPAYAVNSILNNIPLLGPLLGGSGSGVFAATYRMTGKFDDPDISVNPLATLAPGFLRGLFGIFEGGVPKQPDAAPDPSAEKEAPLPEPRNSRR